MHFFKHKKVEEAISVLLLLMFYVKDLKFSLIIIYYNRVC